jgi:hypothetical protein
MTLYEIIERSARAALSLQHGDGSMPPGHNGPYFDAETPVRNTAHWLITFLKAHTLTGDKIFAEAAERAVQYLLSPQARPMNAAFWIRKNPDKDFSNGLIGQAWVIEALVQAARAFSRQDLLDLAKKTFKLHPYDETAGGWKMVHVEGRYGTFDHTFNHQLWFAAAGAMAFQEERGQESQVVESFLGKLPVHVKLYPSGVLRHTSYTFLAPSLANKLRNLYRYFQHFQNPSYRKHKSAGYLGFNLYGFALLHACYPTHSFWSHPKFHKMLNVVGQEDFIGKLDVNKYAYPYNPAGFEIPFALQVFTPGDQKQQQFWIEKQLDQHYDFKQDWMSLNTDDPNTLAARIYEATRLADVPLSSHQRAW